MSEYADDDTGEAKVSATLHTTGSEPTATSSRISNFAQTEERLSQVERSWGLGGDTAAAQATSSGRLPLETADGQATGGVPAWADDTDGNQPGQAGQAAQGSSTRAEFTTAFDIIDEMQTHLAEAKSGIFSPNLVKIDRAKLSSYLDELKTVLPVQLERASALMRESERRLQAAQDQSEAILRAAQRNSDDIIAKANEQADFLAGHQNVVALAEEKARDILTTAQNKADKVVQGSNEYSSTVLEGLEAELEKMTRDVRAGLSVLRGRQQEAATRLERVNLADNPAGGAGDNGQGGVNHGSTAAGQGR